jgi:hypothetical protein
LRSHVAVCAWAKGALDTAGKTDITKAATTPIATASFVLIYLSLSALGWVALDRSRKARDLNS